MAFLASQLINKACFNEYNAYIVVFYYGNLNRIPFLILLTFLKTKYFII